MILSRHPNLFARSLFLLCTAVTLAACGGSDNTIVGPPSGGNGGPGAPGPGSTVTGIQVSADQLRLASDGSNAAIVTAVVFGSGNNVLPDVPVSFEVDSGLVAVLNGVTDAQGRARATVNVGTDSTLRTITVTAAAGNVSTTLGIEVVQALSGIEIAEIQALSNVVQLPSSGALEAEITAVVRDVSRNVVPGVPVAFSATSGSLQTLVGETDASGTARARLSTGANPANRVITVTASAGTLSAVVPIEVVGTTLAVSGPRNLVIGDTAAYVVELKDSSGTGLARRDLAVVSELGNPVNPPFGETNALGQLTFSYEAEVAGTDTLMVSSLDNLVADAGFKATVTDEVFRLALTGVDGILVPLNQSATVDLTWTQGGVPVSGAPVVFTATRGVFNAAASVVTVNTGVDGTATVTVASDNFGPSRISASPAGGGPTTNLDIEFFATSPTRIVLQASPTTVPPGGQSAIEAIVYDANFNRVRDEIVAFQVADVTGGGLSGSLAITDATGKATVGYTAGSTTSASQGVLVTATLQSNPAVTDMIGLTVAERQAFLAVGSDNVLATRPAQFVKTFAVQVTDIQGNPVAGVPVQAKIVSDRYYKGRYTWDLDARIWKLSPDNPIGCDDEDTNRNGILDPDDLQNQAFPERGWNTLEAGNIATVLPGSLVTDADGFGFLEVVYPQEFANWVDVTLEVTANVVGTELSRLNRFKLPITRAVLINEAEPPGLISPFGEAQTCSTLD